MENEKHKNTTSLFECLGEQGKLPSLSESFWTSIFAVFLLHLSHTANGTTQINVWHCKDASTPPRQCKQPYYKLREGKPFMVTGLAIENLGVEVKYLTKEWIDVCGVVDPGIGGIKPDIVLRLPSASMGKAKYVLIENKIRYGTPLSENQKKEYPDLINFLNGQGIQCEYLILQSVSCDNAFFGGLQFLQRKLDDKFGILFWEYILKLMEKTNFRPAGLDIASWVKRYTDDFNTECEV